MTKKADTLYCSFCGKSQHEVIKLIAGPTVFICDECVLLCEDIMTEHHAQRPVTFRLWWNGKFIEEKHDARGPVISKLSSVIGGNNPPWALYHDGRIMVGDYQIGVIIENKE